MRLPVLLLVFSSIAAFIGCSDSGEPDADSAAVVVAPEAAPAASQTGPGRPFVSPTASDAVLPAPNDRSPSRQRPTRRDVRSEPERTARQASELPEGSEATAPLPTDRLQLAPDLKPEELVRFLGKADREMRELASEATSAAEYAQRVPELQRLANLKRAAAERLAEQPGLPSELLRQAKRGRLQALSHLAAMGDLQAAEELEAFARELSESSDPVLAVESRMVLIGFALEQLQGGSSEDPDRVVQLVGELTANSEALDMPALMAVSQARAVLQQYGYSDAAREVRDKLVLAFSEHPDPQLAAMAEQMAGTERFDRLDALRRALDQAESVEPEQWKRAASELVREHPDRVTLQYLATAALGFESEGKGGLADAAYDVLRSGFSDSQDSDLVEELQLVLDSYAARQRIIGEPLEIDLPGLQGQAIDWSDYRGKIVLVPFWAAEYPDSVQVFPLLEQIRAADPNQIAILGVNLDVEDASVAAFTSQMQPDWASVRSPDVAEQGAMNPLAKQVGLASMPYVVIVDREGKVAAVSMAGSELQRIVTELLQEA